MTGHRTKVKDVRCLGIGLNNYIPPVHDTEMM